TCQALHEAGSVSVVLRRREEGDLPDRAHERLLRDGRLNRNQDFFAATIHSSAAPGFRHGLSGARSRVGSGLPAIILASSWATGGPGIAPWPPKPASIHRSSSTSPTYGWPSPPM